MPPASRPLTPLRDREDSNHDLYRCIGRDVDHFCFENLMWCSVLASVAY